jgi:hypothetical protein
LLARARGNGRAMISVLANRLLGLVH